MTINGLGVDSASDVQFSLACMVCQGSISIPNAHCWVFLWPKYGQDWPNVIIATVLILPVDELILYENNE